MKKLVCHTDQLVVSCGMTSLSSWPILHDHCFSGKENGRESEKWCEKHLVFKSFLQTTLHFTLHLSS